MYDISLDTFHIAATVIKSHVVRTPLVPLLCPEQQHTPIYLKAECLQPAGSFKIRGAYFCISRIPPEVRSRGVVAYSTGNHAQAVALVAKKFGIPATIVMSPEAPSF